MVYRTSGVHVRVVLGPEPNSEPGLELAFCDENGVVAYTARR